MNVHPITEAPAPVRIETCWRCQGDGWVELGFGIDNIGTVDRCSICAGRGRIATEGEA